MEKELFWILGFGKFGCMAKVKIEQQKLPETDLVIVDCNSDLLDTSGVNIRCSDAIDWLCLAMNHHRKADWIIPTLPLHVAGEFLRRKLMSKYSVKTSSIPEWLVDKVPNVSNTGEGQVCVSHANWICPDNCYESEDTCTITKKNRPVPMFELLKKLNIGGTRSIVIESKQLFPGIGGYTPDDLDSAVNEVISYPNNKFMVSTACKCHGIIDFIDIN